MLHLDAAAVAASLPYPRLIAALRQGLVSDIETPPRASHAVSPPSDLLLVMPSWRSGDRIGVKLTSVFGSNIGRRLPMIHALYTLIDGRTGVPQAVLDGTELTLRRTAALAALATEELAARTGGRLLVMGTGALSSAMIRAHVALRPWRTISIWGRDAVKAAAVVARLQAEGIAAEVAADAQSSVAAADVLCCVTAASEPILRNGWVRSGTHVNLFGAYLPTMREADSDLMTRGALHVDNRAAALHEAGDVLIPIAEGRFAHAHILAEMREILQPSFTHSADDAVTVFKSVGFGALDLIAAETAVDAKHGLVSQDGGG